MSEDDLNISQLAEDSDLEVKRAAGRDGRGELPGEFWPTYSAMANTNGGVVLLGVEEKPNGIYRVVGIADCPKVLKAIWDGLNNRQQVSVNLLANENVRVVNSEERSVIRIDVPRAHRTQKPVHVGLNPMTGTYRRSFEGDYCCDEEDVRRMIAERVEASRDSRLLDGFSLKDLDPDTFKLYRGQFKLISPDHPWNEQSDEEFLRSIGGWTIDRQSGRSGPTLAGVLMFGKLRPILDALPYYAVDYMERPEAAAEIRWVDRVTTDGTWSGNLYDFYRLVIRKLHAELKVPFRLEGARRVDETPAHEGLREALINTLIHADYTGRVSVLIVKRPGLFAFRNPGTMRLPIEEALRGGISDCRNRNLQKMFRFVGLGEQAGSGIPKIYASWRMQHWRAPEYQEQVLPEQTILTMRLVSLLPEETLGRLDERFGPEFHSLSATQRLALAAVEIEGEVTHSRLKGITSVHPHDLTKELSHLVKSGYLESDGRARGTRYFFPGAPPQAHTPLLSPLTESHLPKGTSLSAAAPPHPMENGAPPVTPPNSAITAANSPIAPPNSPITPPNSLITTPSPPVTNDSDVAEQDSGLIAIAKPARDKRRLHPDEMACVILRLCEKGWLSPALLARLLNRRTTSGLPLGKLARKGFLQARYPEQKKHPSQQYQTSLQGLEWLKTHQDK